MGEIRFNSNKSEPQNIEYRTAEFRRKEWLSILMLNNQGVGEFSSQNYESSGMNYYFTASGCMSERIRHRYEKTSLYSYSHQADG